MRGVAKVGKRYLAATSFHWLNLRGTLTLDFERAVEEHAALIAASSSGCFSHVAISGFSLGPWNCAVKLLLE